MGDDDADADADADVDKDAEDEETSASERSSETSPVLLSDVCSTRSRSDASLDSAEPPFSFLADADDDAVVDTDEDGEDTARS